MPEQLVLNGGTVYTPSEEIPQGVIICEGERIKSVLTKEQVGSILPNQKIEMPGMIVCPGLIDIHLHGALGIDFLDAEEEDLDRILCFHNSQGTTSFLPTLMSAPLDKMLKAAERIICWQKLKNKKGMIQGIHLEGPFLNPNQTGIHDKDTILPPDKFDLSCLIEATEGQIAIMTLAPELDGAMELIHLAKEQNIIISMGHSQAKFEEAQKAIDQGVTHVCHCFNAMGGFHHREPGLLGAVLISSALTAELILDGFHVHPIAAHILIRMLGAAKTILVTDCSSLVGLEEGIYTRELRGEQDIWAKMDNEKMGANENIDIRNYFLGHIRDGRGHLAGSALSLAQAIKNCIKFKLVSLPQAIAMATLNPARLLRLNNEIGQIKPGFIADITVLDKEFNPRMVMSRGEIVYKDFP